MVALLVPINGVWLLALTPPVRIINLYSKKSMAGGEFTKFYSDLRGASWPFLRGSPKEHPDALRKYVLYQQYLTMETME